MTRNVAFGVLDDRIDPEAVRRACRQAQIPDFVERELPDGYQASVGEGPPQEVLERYREGIAGALASEG